MIRLSTRCAGDSAGRIASVGMAQERVEVGVLECRGSTTQLHRRFGHRAELRFRPSGGGPPEAYTRHDAARRRRYRHSTSRSSWPGAVFAPTRGSRRGDLAGNYGGGAASATVGVGVGANALIGGSGNTIALQPLSVQGQTG